MVIYGYRCLHMIIDGEKMVIYGYMFYYCNSYHLSLWIMVVIITIDGYRLLWTIHYNHYNNDDLMIVII